MPEPLTHVGQNPCTQRRRAILYRLAEHEHGKARRAPCSRCFDHAAAGQPSFPGAIDTALDAAPHAWSGQAAAAGLVGAECGRG